MRSAAVNHSVTAVLQKFRPPEAGQKILVAVSGGLDSMALLHLLRRFSDKRRWKLTVAHFNHHLRGRASNADETFVRRTAVAMKLPFVVGGADVKQFAKESKLSIEMAARKLRHDFFARAARERKIKMVALAHHADDQVELFLLRLLRGAGGGLGGMKWRSPSPVDKGISLVRPLLNFSRAELEEFTRENKIRYREDATNASVEFLRNRIRHELLPLLRRHYQPGLNKAILRLMDIAGAESDLAGGMAHSWLVGAIMGDFEKLPVAVQRHILRQQLAKHGIGVDFDLIELLRRSANQFVSVGASVSVSRDAKGMVSVREHWGTEFDEHELIVKLDKPGHVIFGGVKFNWQFGTGRKTPKSSTSSGKSGREFFDANKVGKEIVLRHWRPGDRFHPIGFKSATKLQDQFTNKKIPRERRHQSIVAAAGGEIFWVEGLRISEKFKLTPGTKRVLAWGWKRLSFR